MPSRGAERRGPAELSTEVFREGQALECGTLLPPYLPSQRVAFTEIGPKQSSLLSAGILIHVVGIGYLRKDKVADFV